MDKGEAENSGKNKVHHKKVGNYVVYGEINEDTLGQNYRVGKILDGTVHGHRILSRVRPVLAENPRIWHRLTLLAQGIARSQVPHIYCPEDVIKGEAGGLLVYPFLRANPLEKVIADAQRKHIPLDIDVVFSLALGITDLLQTAGSIVVNKHKSFHGLLTPDNLFLDSDGQLYIKNYGIFPYIGISDSFYREIVEKYGHRLPPEYVSRHQLTPESDIYCVGNLLYRLLTGTEYRPQPGMDFEKQLLHVQLQPDIYTEDRDFIPNVITLFRKSLAPEPAGRFKDITQLKNFITARFPVEEVSSSLFVLAYFMNLVYHPKEMEKETNALNEELTYRPPTPGPVHQDAENAGKNPDKNPADQLGEMPDESALTGELMVRLEGEKRLRRRYLLPLAAVFLIVAIMSVYLLLVQQKTVSLQQEQRTKSEQGLRADIARLEKNLRDEYERRLKEIENRAVETEKQKLDKEEEIAQLRDWQQQQEQKNRNQIQALRESLQETRANLANNSGTNSENNPENNSETTPETNAGNSGSTSGPNPVKSPEQQSPPVIAAGGVVEKTAVEKTAGPNQGTPAPTPRSTVSATVVRTGDLVPLDQVTHPPNLLAGKTRIKAKELRLSDSTMKKYAGMELEVSAQLSIDETGTVTDVKIKDALSPGFKVRVARLMTQWQYIPAEKGPAKVKVRVPAVLKIQFGGLPTSPSRDQIVDLESVTFRPSIMKGKSRYTAQEMDFSRTLRKKYRGRTLTVRFRLLLGNTGAVEDITLEEKWPPELVVRVRRVVKGWHYVPAQLNRVNVKTWYPSRMIIEF